MSCTCNRSVHNIQPYDGYKLELCPPIQELLVTSLARVKIFHEIVEDQHKLQTTATYAVCNIHGVKLWVSFGYAENMFTGRIQLCAVEDVHSKLEPMLAELKSKYLPS